MQEGKCLLRKAASELEARVTSMKNKGQNGAGCQYGSNYKNKIIKIRCFSYQIEMNTQFSSMYYISNFSNFGYCLEEKI